MGYDVLDLLYWSVIIAQKKFKHTRLISVHVMLRPCLYKIWDFLIEL
jgi:hypothetical protein